MMLCLFISVSTIDFGIMTLTVGPTYAQPAWLTSWYWLLPYAVAALLMKRIKAWIERSSMLYIAFGMIGLSFILFLVLHRSISSYLIIFTLMMSAWAIFDVFWWSTLGEMLDMHNNAALVLGVGYSANAFGVFNGKLLGNVQLSITGTENTLIPLAVICVTLVILPLLNQSISKLLISGKSDVYTRSGSAGLALINGGSTVAFAVPQPAQEADAVFASGSPDVLTEREKQIVTLLLKGRTYKLIASELYLSENTVKTHVKNIYAKLAVRTKSELFKKFDPS
jgi:DNA-binding CsgD family transcriptional regulator